jgi:hypothetical protein
MGPLGVEPEAKLFPISEGKNSRRPSSTNPPPLSTAIRTAWRAPGEDQDTVAFVKLQPGKG